MNVPDLSRVSLNTADTAYRVAMACKIINHIRDRLTKGDFYSGMWAPNLQSALDCFYVPMHYLLEAVASNPEFAPTPQEVAECAKALSEESCPRV